MKSKLGRVFGNMALGLISIGVLLFLGSHSLNFFQFTFTAQNQIYSWLGLLLTSGGAIGWLVVFLSIADTPLRKATALIMCAIGFVGEMVTAVFDMQYAAVYSTGFQFQPDELRTMTTVIGILGLVTGLALAAYAAGDKIIEAFGDDDGDGIPNYKDRDYKPRQQRPAYAQTAPQVQQNVGTSYTIADLESASGMNKAQIVKQYRNREAFGKFAAESFDYISGGNIKRLYNELMGQGNGSNPTNQPRHS